LLGVEPRGDLSAVLLGQVGADIAGQLVELAGRDVFGLHHEVGVELGAHRLEHVDLGRQEFIDGKPMNRPRTGWSDARRARWEGRPTG
jgi:hypothetical protein